MLPGGLKSVSQAVVSHQSSQLINSNNYHASAPMKGSSRRWRRLEPPETAYFFLAGPGRPERNEIPERIAFCWTAAGVLPRVLAACMAVPSLASFFRVLSSLALQEAPSFEGRLAIQILLRDKQ